MILDADVFTISGPISYILFPISSSSDELADADEREELNGSV